MDPAKVKAVQDWEPQKSVKSLQSFLGFSNFYRRFIKDYSRVAGPLFQLLRKDSPYIWGQAQQQAFEDLKTRFTTGPILRYFNPDLNTVLETDASG